MTERRDQTWWIDSLFLMLTLGALFFILLGVRPLFVPDEGRYAEIAREMATSGNYITPYLDGIKYFEKPALFYWLTAIAMKIGGINLWSVRSVNALIGLCGCLLTYLTTRKLYDRTTGLLAAMVLGTSALYFIMAHMVSLDLPVTVFIAASLYAWILGTQQADDRGRRLYCWAAAACAALAVLTKGLIGIVFPSMIVCAWIIAIGDYRMLQRMYLPSSILLFFLIAAPWHILVNQHNPEFLYFYFVEQHFLRYTTLEVGHYQPAWFFIPCLAIGFFPWIAFLPQAIATSVPQQWQLRTQYKTELFLLIWVVLVFAFFSFSKSKLIPYILPIFPALAILTARYLMQGKKCGIRAGFACLGLFSLVIGYTLYTYTHHNALPNIAQAQCYLNITSLILIVGTLLSLLIVMRCRIKAIVVLIITTSLFLLGIIAAMPAIDTRTIQPLTVILKPILGPTDRVITYNQYYQDLPFYLERQVSILNWRNELTYGIEHQPAHAWMIDTPTFWQQWDSNRRVFVIISSDEYAKLKYQYPKAKIYVLGTTINNLLISNKS